MPLTQRAKPPTARCLLIAVALCLAPGITLASAPPEPQPAPERRRQDAPADKSAARIEVEEAAPMDAPPVVAPVLPDPRLKVIPWEQLIQGQAVGGVAIPNSPPPILRTGIPQRPARLEQTAARQMLTNLLDPDPAERDHARQALLALDRSELPVLRDAVAAMLPLSSEQLRVLEEVVQHVYLAAEPYAIEGASGFLGITIAEAAISLSAESADDDVPPDVPPDAPRAPGRLRALQPQPVPPGQVPGLPGQAAEPAPSSQGQARIGIVVSDPIPGLAAYRYLEEGDVIVGIGPVRSFQNINDFMSVVRSLPAGARVSVRVIRRGLLTNVDLVLSHRPANNLNDPPMAASARLQGERYNLARQYWTRQFAPLVGDRTALRPPSTDRPNADHPDDGEPRPEPDAVP